jgi:hypothetical protein
LLLREGDESASVATAAAIATAVAATAAATTAATVAASATAATAATAIFARAGFVHGQGASAVLLAVEPRDRRLGFFVAAHFDESETFASTGVAIVDDLGRHHLAKLLEHLFEL